MTSQAERVETLRRERCLNSYAPTNRGSSEKTLDCALRRHRHRAVGPGLGFVPGACQCLATQNPRSTQTRRPAGYKAGYFRYTLDNRAWARGKSFSPPRAQRASRNLVSDLRFEDFKGQRKIKPQRHSARSRNQIFTTDGHG